jgi:hypothetical protein
MTKRDLIALRDSTEDPEVKKALRWAITRIEMLEDQLREVNTLCKSIQRAAALRNDAYDD